jgi:hypothetical protein
LKENYLEYEKINQNMIKRIWLREYIYDLWAINWEFLNKEIFWLNLHIDNYWQIFPITYINIFDKIWIFFYRKKSVVLEKIGENDFYHKVLVKFLSKFIWKITKTLKRNKMLPRNFKYKILSANSTDIKIVSNYYDDLITKSFITYLHKIFSIITNQRYILEIPFNKLGIKENYYFWLWDELVKNKRFRKNLERELMWFFINNRTKILYLNSDKIDKKNYIWKRPFITWKIEKLWI